MSPSIYFMHCQTKTHVKHKYQYSERYRLWSLKFVQKWERNVYFKWLSIAYIWCQVNWHNFCTIADYHSCIIDKYRNVEGPKCDNFGRLVISCFEQERFCETHPKSWESFLHILFPPGVIWGPPILGVWVIIYLLGDLSDCKLSLPCTCTVLYNYSLP